MTSFQRIGTLLLISLFIIYTFAYETSPLASYIEKQDASAGAVIDKLKATPLHVEKDDTAASKKTTGNVKLASGQHQQEDVDYLDIDFDMLDGTNLQQQDQNGAHFTSSDRKSGSSPPYSSEDEMGSEIDQILEFGPPPQELETFIDEDQTGSDTEDTEDVEDGIQSSLPEIASELDDSIIADATNSTNTTTAAPSHTNFAPVAQVTGCKTQGQIALTYSEGPSDVTAKIVRQLTKADARANFFINATWLYTQQYAMVVQNIYNAGHFIGMTYRVPGDDPSTLTDDELRQDIIRDAHIIEGLIGLSPKYVRLHYTEAKDIRTEGIIRDLGFVIVGYNLDSQDYIKKESTGPNSIKEVYSDTFKKYKDTYDAKGSFISIQYDLPYTGSLAAIPHVINTIHEEGYSMVRLDGCLNDATPYKKTANGTEYIGDRFSYSTAGYHQGQKAIEINPDAAVAAAEVNAEVDDMLFSIQGSENMSNCQQAPVYLLLVAIGAVFSLFL